MKKQTEKFTMDDIVFEGRNKQYGAYQLRQEQNGNLFKSTVATVLIFIVAILVTKFNLKAEVKPSEIIQKIDLINSDVDIPTQEQLAEEYVEPQQEVKQEVHAEIEYKEYNVQKDHLVDNTDHTTIDEIRNTDAKISDKTVISDISPSLNIVDHIPSNHDAGPNAGNSVDTDAIGASSKIYDFTEEQPEFPGGSKAMMEFLLKNVRYPETALDNAIEGTAVVQFVIEKDGSVSEVRVVRDPGGGLGEEAERVVKAMPRWKPGKQSNKAVRVKMSAPVRFKLER